MHSRLRGAAEPAVSQPAAKKAGVGMAVRYRQNRSFFSVTCWPPATAAGAAAAARRRRRRGGGPTMWPRQPPTGLQLDHSAPRRRRYGAMAAKQHTAASIALLLACCCCLAREIGSSVATGSSDTASHRLLIVSNRVQTGWAAGAPVRTVAELQAVLDNSPGVIEVHASRWQVSNRTISLRSHRTLLMDAATTITGTAPIPWTKHGTGEVGEGGGALLTVSGTNISVAGGRFEQEILPACEGVKTQPTPGACNFAVDIYYSSGVTLRDSVVQGSFMSAVRVQESVGWPAGVKPGAPPVASKWVTLPGLARQPTLITNVTLLHHRNASFFQLRGFWTVMAANVIFTRNTILGPFAYAIDLDSSSSGNLVTNNYMKGCLWEGIFTEYSAVHNVITGNTVVANCTYNQAIHINGELNVVVVRGRHFKWHSHV
jgi:parallel beta-helix repeat protein